MLKQETIEAVIAEIAHLQGHELNEQEMLQLRIRVAACLSAKERHRQRMSAKPFQWKKPDKLRK
ncbi:hypothetical protein MWS90_003640 [Citrobacter sedlakii]|nr:hypothetical protein [Citrobacter sedlakii]